LLLRSDLLLLLRLPALLIDAPRDNLDRRRDEPWPTSFFRSVFDDGRVLDDGRELDDGRVLDDGRELDDGRVLDDGRELDELRELLLTRDEA